MISAMVVYQALHHVAVTVSDIDRAKRFYGDVLGLTEIARPPFDFGGAWYQIGENQLHLIVHPPTRTMRRTREIDSRDGHLALRVANYDDTLAYLKGRGVDILERPQNITPWAQIYLTDPDGNVVELNAPR
jgi:glyoxylase I family protein